jgi:acyl-coenzyme A thioesterase PaaI-like protein
MRRRVLAVQNVSRMCVVCGQDNAWSLKARFYELEGGELLAIFAPLQEHQGFPGRLHGGIASTLLDETIGRAINILHPDTWGVTVELTVRFRKPIPLDHEVHALARITRDSSRLFEGSGEIVLADGTVAVTSSGKFMKAPIDKITDGDFADQWFPDPLDAPDAVDV